MSEPPTAIPERTARATVSEWCTYEAAEAAKWGQYFADAAEGHGQEHQNQLWWWLSDRDTLDILRPWVAAIPIRTVLEAGCGSGGSTVRLMEHFGLEHASLLDLSEDALRYARTLVPPEQEQRYTFLQGSAFDLPFRDGVFDLTWNVGVVEHYPLAAIGQMVREMVRVTKPGGIVVIGIPNRSSIATLKAWLLGTAFGRAFLKFLPGYRFDTEILYRTQDLKSLCERECNVRVELGFAGSILWVGAPVWLVRACDAWGILPRHKFLLYLILRRHDSC